MYVLCSSRIRNRSKLWYKAEPKGPQERLLRPCAAAFLTQTVRFFCFATPRSALCSLCNVAAAADFLACWIFGLFFGPGGIILGLDDDKKLNKYIERDETHTKNDMAWHQNFKLLAPRVKRSGFFSDDSGRRARHYFLSMLFERPHGHAWRGSRTLRASAAAPNQKYCHDLISRRQPPPTSCCCWPAVHNNKKKHQRDILK